jgi:hypothetical protein
MSKIREVPGFPGYKVDKEGNVYGRGGKRMQTRINKGYLVVNLCVYRVPYRLAMKITKKVHSLVLEAFVSPKPTNKHQARHLDGNSTNNKLENLCWGTAKENAADKKRHGTHRIPPAKSKYSGQVEIIKSLRFEKKLSMREIANRYKTSATQIRRILKGLWG